MELDFINGSEKKKVLQYFPVSNFISGLRGIKIEKLWKEFYYLYQILRKPFLSDSEIELFETNAKSGFVPFINQLEEISILLHLFLVYTESKMLLHICMFWDIIFINLCDN